MKMKAQPAGLSRPAVIGACVFFLLLPSSFPTALSAQEPRSPWQAEFTDLTVEIDPAQGILKGDARLWLARAGPGGAEVLLEINHELVVDSVSDDSGRALAYERNSQDLIVHRAAAPVASDTRLIRVRYHGSFQQCIPELELRNAWIGPRMAYAFFSSCWYPRLPAPCRRSRGQVSFLVPKDWAVAGPGRRVETENLPGARRHVFRVSRPVEFSFAAAAFDHCRETVDGVEVGIFLLQGGAAKMKFYLENGTAVIRFFRELYGFFPYESCSIIEIPTEHLGKAGAGSYEGLTFYPSGILSDRFFYATVFGHEISHCWWGGCVRGLEGAVVNEGLAQISMGLYLEHAFGRDFLWDLLKNGSPQFRFPHSARLFFRSLQSPRAHGQGVESLLLRGEDAELAKATQSRFTTQHMLANSKGFFVYAMLREMIGPDAFRRGLRETLKKFAWQTLALDDLRAQFEAASGSDLRWFFDQWFQRKGAPEFSMDYRVLPQKTSWLVRGTITQLREVYRVKADIACFKGDRRENRNLEINGRRTPFSIILPFQPQTIRFDPDYRILRWSEQF